MNMKKIVAGVAASALALGTMAVSAFAADYKDTYTYSTDLASINTKDDGTFYAQIQLGHVAGCESITVTYTAADGTTGYMLMGNDWGTAMEDAFEANNYKWETAAWSGAPLYLPEGVEIEGTTVEMTIKVDIDAAVAAQVEAWGEDAVADIQIIVFGANSDGKKTIYIEEAAAAETDPAPAPADTTAPDNTPAPGANDGAGDGKEPANTGIEGVAVVAGLAILATGAIVVAKKRK